MTNSTPMNILLLGGGGREHALADIISRSPLCGKLFIAPGNAGTQKCGLNVKLSHSDFDEIGYFTLENKIDLLVVGPEDPIVNGIADYFAGSEKYSGVAVLAPSRAGARLEGSKHFAKLFMQNYNIPTAAYESFRNTEYEEAKKYILSRNFPLVVKADGLAAGKGVIICKNREEAFSAIEDLFVNKKFGQAGERVVIEEFLVGIELSVFVLTDGRNYILLPSAKDYKRVGEGDTGLNTGGMGCVSPPPFADEAFMKKVQEKIIRPTMEGLQKENISYRGFIFFGLMNSGGNPYVIEYNVRLGDPESEVILPRIDEDFLPYMMNAAKGNLSGTSVKIKSAFCTTVMLVSGGYPGSYEKGKPISGLEQEGNNIIFHAGTALEGDKTITSGGRVLAVTALDDNLEKALEKSYELADKILFENKYFRRDIGKDLLQYI